MRALSRGVDARLFDAHPRLAKAVLALAGVRPLMR